MNRPWQESIAAVGLGVLVAGMTALLATAVWHLPTESLGLAEEVNTHLDQAGASNPVTAVLLNFRSYDTLLELAVLLLAVIGAQVLAGDEPPKIKSRGTAAGPATRDEPNGNPVLLGFIRVFAPLMIVVAGYILWVGGHAPGGAFQAGAVLAALGVLLLLGGVRVGTGVSVCAERWVLVAGLVAFLTVGVGTMIGPRRFLEYPVPGAKWLVLLIETFATISIAAILVALFRGGRLITAARTRHRTSEKRA